MSLLLPVNTETEPEIGAPAEGRVISGNPQFRTWNAEETSDGLYVGVWESTAGKWHVTYDEWEFFQLISGVSVLTEEGKTPLTLRAGDSFIIRPGFKGSWEVIETTRKTYVIKL
ncbi:cupin domain-containing protein [Pseudochrobactrum sp. sp1633]|uniref:cupin domain-containing protein n=1 Tax=Pseudochrobactrum sp. sp1633 TaxID=3036706 RepID=UPI0025A5A678|nr:cupin domain-containing protein [Pseudochrobactrum sp. sp1633]MDM8344613.1 cupin domain-containing protein [Pseudochrobactrum sp. sp1633]HWD13627.1 cupin domain-containing protein [Pseudochrobactrum sp.]